MIRDDVKKLAQILISAYPNFKPIDLSAFIDAWTSVLEDEDTKEITIALKSYIRSDVSGFAPTLGQLIQHKNAIFEKGDEGLNEEAAWALAYKAICNSNHHAEEEFNKLPETVQKAVVSPANLRTLAESDEKMVQSVEKSHFIRTFRAEKEKKRQYDSLSKKDKQMLELIKQATNGIENRNSTIEQLETAQTINCKGKQ